MRGFVSWSIHATSASLYLSQPLVLDASASDGSILLQAGPGRASLAGLISRAMHN